jgi:hypothetical protein
VSSCALFDRRVKTSVGLLQRFGSLHCAGADIDQLGGLLVRSPKTFVQFCTKVFCLFLSTTACVSVFSFKLALLRFLLQPGQNLDG